MTAKAGPSFRTTASDRLTVAAAASVLGVLGRGSGAMAAGLPAAASVATPTSCEVVEAAVRDEERVHGRRSPPPRAPRAVG